jgi:hypothetical protein
MISNSGFSAWPCSNRRPIGATRFPQHKQPRTHIYAARTRPNISREAEPGDKSLSGDNVAARSALIAAVLASASTAAFVAFREPIEDFLQDNMNELIGLGDVFGVSLWSFALFYTSPLQLLLLFLGKIDTERPSDWLTRKLGMAAGLEIDDLDFTAPQWIQFVVISICISQALIITLFLSQSLGDSTWAVSSGIGACFAAFLYEVGRPRKLEKDEALLLESQLLDFATWAKARLQPRGSCHETEIFTAFRRENSKYRSTETITDEILRDMVRNWSRRCSGEQLDRTSRGFMKGVSLRVRSDPFTGETTGVVFKPAQQELVTVSSEKDTDADV